MAQIDLTRADAEGGDSPLRRLVLQRMSDQGLTLEDVARRGGLAVATVAALRSGGRGRRPGPATLERLAAGLGLDVDDVLAAAVDAERSSSLEDLMLHHFRQLEEAQQRLVVQQVLLAREAGATGRRVGR